MGNGVITYDMQKNKKDDSNFTFTNIIIILNNLHPAIDQSHLHFLGLLIEIIK